MVGQKSRYIYVEGVQVASLEMRFFFCVSRGPLCQPGKHDTRTTKEPGNPWSFLFALDHPYTACCALYVRLYNLECMSCKR